MAYTFKPENVGHKAPKTASLLLALPLAAGLLSSKAGAETENTATKAPVAVEQYTYVSGALIIRGLVTSCQKKGECVLHSNVKAGDSLFRMTHARTGALVAEAKVTQVGQNGVTFALGVGPASEISETFTLNYDGTGTKVPSLLERIGFNWSGWKAERTADPKVAEIRLPRYFDSSPASKWTQKTKTETIGKGVEINIPAPTHKLMLDRIFDAPVVTKVDGKGVEFVFPYQAVQPPETGSHAAGPVRLDFGQECTIMRGMSVLSLKAQKRTSQYTADLTVTEMEPVTGGSGSK
jgi:hypothetical protein